jgi:hypothetical protein
MTMAKKNTAKTEEINEVKTGNVPATQGSREIGAPVSLSEWGVEAGSLTSRDITIPKILPMQGLSKKVTARQASFGEFRTSDNNALVGTIDKPIQFIPFYLEKVWIIFHEEKGNFKFKGLEPITPRNENLPYEEINAEGVKVRRDRTMNFYVLLADEVEKGGAIPYVISFRRTSLRAGQQLATQMFVKNVEAGKTPASVVCELGGSSQSNDKGTFVVLNVAAKRDSSASEVGTAFKWVKTIKQGQAKVDNSDYAEEASTMSGGSTQTPGSEQF